MVERARLDAAEGRFDEALRQVAEVWSRDSALESAGLLETALLLHAQHKPDAALEAYRQVIAKHPRSAAARDGAVQILVRTEKIDAAKAELAELQRFSPRRPETAMLQALLAFEAKDVVSTREATTRLLSIAANHLPGLLLAAATEMQTRQWAAAQSLLARVIKLEPRHAPALRDLDPRVDRLEADPARRLHLVRPGTTAPVHQTPPAQPWRRCGGRGRAGHGDTESHEPRVHFEHEFAQCLAVHRR